MRGVGAALKQALQSAAEFVSSDLPGVGLADGRQVRGVVEAALEKGQFVVEFEAVDVEGIRGRADPPQRFLRKQALVRQIMDGQDGRDLASAPGEVGRHQRRLPIIGVDEVGCPILVQCARGEFGSHQGQSSETDIVVRPVMPGFVAIGVARPIVQLWTQHHVDRQTILGRSQTERAGRHLRERGRMADNLKMRELLDNFAVTGKQDPDIGPAPERPR